MYKHKKTTVNGRGGGDNPLLLGSRCVCMGPGRINTYKQTAIVRSNFCFRELMCHTWGESYTYCVFSERERFIANFEILIAHFWEFIKLNKTPQIILAQGYSLLMDVILCVKKLRS